jgi:hypothetical protein
MTEIVLDPTKLMILMVVGGIFAAFALYLMVRPAAHGSAKIEIFGLKFESSSAALLVFLVGAGLLSLPLWVKERAGSMGDVRDPTGRIAGTNGTASPPTVQAVLLPAEANANEAEPNDSIHKSNQIAPNSTVRGTVRTEDQDWYVIDTSGAGEMDLEIGIRRITQQVGYRIYDAAEAVLEETEYEFQEIDAGARRFRFGTRDSERFYIQIFAEPGTEYEVFFTLEAPEN